VAKQNSRDEGRGLSPVGVVQSRRLDNASPSESIFRASFDSFKNGCAIGLPGLEFLPRLEVPRVGDRFSNTTKRDFLYSFYHAPLEPLAFTNRSLKRQLVGFVAYVFVLAERSRASH